MRGLHAEPVYDGDQEGLLDMMTPTPMVMNPVIPMFVFAEHCDDFDFWCVPQESVKGGQRGRILRPRHHLQ